MSVVDGRSARVRTARPRARSPGRGARPTRTVSTATGTHTKPSPNPSTLPASWKEESSSSGSTRNAGQVVAARMRRWSGGSMVPLASVPRSSIQWALQNSGPSATGSLEVR